MRSTLAAGERIQIAGEATEKKTENQQAEAGVARRGLESIFLKDRRK